MLSQLSLFFPSAIFESALRKMPRHVIPQSAFMENSHSAGRSKINAEHPPLGLPRNKLKFLREARIFHNLI